MSVKLGHSNVRTGPGNFGLKEIWSGNDSLPRLSTGGMLRHLFFRAWGGILSSPVTALVSIVTIAVSLFLFGLFLMVVSNLRQALVTTQSDMTLTVFLTEAANDAVIKQLTADLKALPEVASVSLTTKDQALARLRRDLSEAKGVLDGLENSNPLPESLEVTFRPLLDARATFAALKNEFENRDGVELVHFRQGTLGQLGRVLELFRYAVMGALALMLLLTGFIIANTIRLALFSRKDEIEIMWLVGATQGFVRAPYLFEGIIKGFCGSVTSLVFLFLFFRAVNQIIVTNPIIAEVLPRLQFLGFVAIALVIFLGVGVGALGSFLAVKRFLSS